MLESGISQKEIAQTLGVTVKTVWKTKSLSGKSMASIASIKSIRRFSVKRASLSAFLTDKTSSGRPTRLSRILKIIIRKSLGKRSTRKLACIVSKNSKRVSKDTIHRYLRNTIGTKPYKRPSHPKLSEKQKEQRLKLCLSHKFWGTGLEKGSF